jgi:uncharacterized protein
MISDNNKEFNSICKDILNNSEFNKLKNEPHHGITRYDHSLRVAKTVFKWAKQDHLNDYKDITRAALLHDFYTNDEMEELSSYERLSAHPKLALNNAKKYFKINKMQEDIIKNHMYPATKTKPNTKEGKMVSKADKLVATYEMCHYKFGIQFGVLVLFIVKLINIQK